jgi:hypothetical protein
MYLYRPITQQTGIMWVTASSWYFQSSSQMLLHERHWPFVLSQSLLDIHFHTHWCCEFPSSRRLNGCFSLFSYLHLVFSCSRITGPSSPPHFRSFYLTISLWFLGRIQPIIIATQNGIICITKTKTQTHTLTLSLSLTVSRQHQKIENLL